MFNVIINSEQYDEFMAQKEKIKELEARNEFLKEQYDQLNEKCQANSNHYQGLYEELVQTVHEKDKEREFLYKNYQQALSDKAAIIKERDKLTNVVHSQGSEIINLRSKNRDLVTETYRFKIANNDLKEQNEAIIKERDDLLIENDELKNKVTRFGELVSENYRLRQSIVDLRANNKELKAKINEPVAAITINPCRDLEDALKTDNNSVINIKNLYFTNNYFSEEDERDD